jgi:hypothetical protein
MAFVLPSRREAGYLDPSIAGEGSKVIMSDGEVITYNPPPPKPVMPDWSEIKSIRHYFNRTYPKTQTWPAWVYHPTEEPRILKNADEAAELGICYRETSPDERVRFGQEFVWDWKDDCQWRPKPYPKKRTYDPRKPEAGKEFVAFPVPQATANRELLNTVLPEVTAAVVAALKQGGSVNPDNVDPKQWDEFLAFQAWKKTQEAADAILSDDQPEGYALTADGLPPKRASEMLPDIERAELTQQAHDMGIKVDGRWSVERIRSEIEKRQAN